MVETRRSFASKRPSSSPSSPSSSSVPPPKRPKAEAAPSPTASARGRTEEEEDSAAAAAARTAGSAEDATAQKDGAFGSYLGFLWSVFGIELMGFECFPLDQDQGADKPASAPAESLKRKKDQEQQQPTGPWAKLLSQSSQTPHLPISASQFSVHQNKNCNFGLKDQPVSKMLCKLWRLEQGGQCELEVISRKGMVQLSGRFMGPGTKVPLTGGDEVVFGSCGKHAYIFQHPLNDKVPKTMPSSAVRRCVEAG